VEDILLFNDFFPVVDTCLTYSPTNLCDGAQTKC